MKILIINIISLLFVSLAFGHEESRFENKQLKNENHQHKSQKHLKK
tara:strand:- start:748 stop:885 length:138 start_codon:yes stop_codon:yes gene_type:complete